VIERVELPAEALLSRYVRDGAYTDCYATIVPGTVTHAQYVQSFYTGFVFRLERFLLAAFARRPSTDSDVAELAAGTRDVFAAWDVEARARDQLLLRDFTGRTRSWLMVQDAGSPGAPQTRLLFGSAVTAIIDKATGERSLGRRFSALLGFHKLYSRVLLSAARRRVLRAIRGLR